MFTVYKWAMERFKEEGIDISPIGSEGETVTLRLSKDGFSCNTVFNFESDNAKEETEYAIKAFLVCLDYYKQEQEKQARKQRKSGK